MQRTISSRVRALLVMLVASTALVALPAIANATVATRGTGVQTQRESFMRYLYGLGFGGTVTASGGATFARNTASYADDTNTYVFNSANTTYNITSTAGRGTIAFTGGIDYAMAAHYIDVSISDPRIVLTSPTATATVSALVSYDPYETSGAQIRNKTTPTRQDVFTLTTSGAFGGLGGATHTWTGAPAALTAAGANAFNGGINGSYRTGDAFGSWSFSAGY